MAGDSAPAAELRTSILELLSDEVLDLFEEAEGFHFYDDDEVSERQGHLEAEVSKAKKALELLRHKSAH